MSTFHSNALYFIACKKLKQQRKKTTNAAIAQFLSLFFVLINKMCYFSIYTFVVCICTYAQLYQFFSFVFFLSVQLVAVFHLMIGILLLSFALHYIKFPLLQQTYRDSSKMYYLINVTSSLVVIIDIMAWFNTVSCDKPAPV